MDPDTTSLPFESRYPSVMTELPLSYSQQECSEKEGGFSGESLWLSFSSCLQVLPDVQLRRHNTALHPNKIPWKANWMNNVHFHQILWHKPPQFSTIICSKMNISWHLYEWIAELNTTTSLVLKRLSFGGFVGYYSFWPPAKGAAVFLFVSPSLKSFSWKSAQQKVCYLSG